MTNLTATKMSGLLIDKHCVKDAKSKARASQSLTDWQRVELTPREWIGELEKGRTIQPSAFSPTDTDEFTHAIDQWHGTHFVCCDADNLKGVEFTADGIDKNSEGIEPWTDEKGLSALYPCLKKEVFAVGQSVSSMTEAKRFAKVHRRYRLIFLFDEQIITAEHYHVVLLALSAVYPIIPPVTRAPSQPVFGNAREGYNKFSICDNVLKLSDYPMPQEKPKLRATSKRAAGVSDKTLDVFLTEHNIAYEACAKKANKYFVQCPFSEYHTDGICKPKDAYVFVNAEGAFAFHCSHTSCRSAGRSSWQAFKEGYNIRNVTPQRKQTSDFDASYSSVFYNGKKFLPMAMESYLLGKGNRYLSLSEEQGLRVYRDGIYVREREIEKQDRLLRAMQEALGGEFFKMSHYKEVLSMLLESATPLSECDNTGYLCVANGILNLDTLELTKHTPERVFLSRLPVEYNPKAQCPDIAEWLFDVLESDQKQVVLFLEAVGYTLLQTTELQKLFILEGPTKTGKSTAGKLLRALLGADNVSNVSLHAIDDEDNRFQRVRLLGKVANISSDISAKRLKGDGYVKAAVSGDPIEAESKGVDSFTFIPRATLWAMANRVPGSYDKTSAWYERLLIIPFKKQFLPGSANPPDTQILKKLTTPAELSGVLTLALLCGKEALARGAFATTEKQTEAVEQVKERNDAVYAFVQSLEGTIAHWDDGEFYHIYTKWVEQEEGKETKPLSKIKLADACKVHGIVRAKRGPRDNRAWIWERKNVS